MNVRVVITDGLVRHDLFLFRQSNGFVTGKRFSIDRPAPTIMAAGMAGDSLGHWRFINDGYECVYDNGGWEKDHVITDKPAPTLLTSGMNHFKVRKMKKSMQIRIDEKPPYHVPLMEEIRAIPWNGLRVASTFSGAGGSCTGYRMAGFRVVWANEFVPAAQESYKANASEHCTLDGRDIRRVTTEDILEATQLKRGELDIFDGSPPCQAFSTAGKRHKNWGKEKTYEHGAKQCNERLFDEYIRLLVGLQPKAFIAENVAGLVKGTAKGAFLDILKSLKDSGYNVRCKVLNAAWLGVPQSRNRTIFIGIRNDLNIEPTFPKPLPYQYTVRDALPWLDSLAIRQYDNSSKDISNQPAQAITCTPITSGYNRRGYKIEDGPSYKGYGIEKDADALKPGEKSKRNQSLERTHPDKPSPTILACHGFPGIASPIHPNESRKFTIAEVKRLCAFPDDFVLKGTYSQQWERLGNSVPPVMMYHIAANLRNSVFSQIS